MRIRVVKTSGGPPPQEINEPVSTAGADRTGFMRFADGYYLYNLSGRALPDPSGTYRVEMTLPNGQVATALFRPQTLIISRTRSLETPGSRSP